MNTSRGVKNIICGIGYQVLTMAISIVIPRLVLLKLGSEINGLTHSISSIFTYLTLLEAGVGKATQQALYKPLAEDNKDAINRIMSATNKYYRRTGIVYAIVVFVFAVVYCLFVSTTIPIWIVFWVIILSGASSVISYFVQGKYRVLMETEGKTYILTNLSSVCTICVSIFKIILLIYGFGIVAIQGMYLFFSLLQMGAIVYYIRRYYEWIDLNVEPNYAAISQKNYVLLHQITGMIFNNTDVLLLTIFTNLKTVSVYSMYATFYDIIKSVLNTISFSFSYVLGQVFHTDKEKFAKLHDVYELYNMSLTFSLICVLNLFILPFMKIYTDGVTDINYIDSTIPLLFTSVNLLSNGRASSSLVIDFAQHFEQTKERAILESFINIIISIIGIYFFGIYGALFGTIFALFYRANDMIIYASRLMHRTPLITYKRWIYNLIIFVIITIIASHIMPIMDSIIDVVVCGIVGCMIIIPVFLILDSIFEWKTACYAFHLLRKKNKT